MNAKIVFLQTLVPVLSQMSRSPNKGLAAEAVEEMSHKTAELATLQRQEADQAKEAA
jgi:hypothetical protein